MSITCKVFGTEPGRWKVQSTWQLFLFIIQPSLQTTNCHLCCSFIHSINIYLCLQWRNVMCVFSYVNATALSQEEREWFRKQSQLFTSLMIAPERIRKPEMGTLVYVGLSHCVSNRLWLWAWSIIIASGEHWQSKPKLKRIQVTLKGCTRAHTHTHTCNAHTYTHTTHLHTHIWMHTHNL